MSSINAALEIIGETLDGLRVAMCMFDEQDQALVWNRTFLDVFPEHAADIRAGEPYSRNLRRFYRARLSDAELPAIERYVEEGVARHRTQQRPFVFENRGTKLLVSSLPIPGVGRIRMWRPADDGAPDALAPGASVPDLTGLPGGDAASLFDRLADGFAVTRFDGGIAWVNQAFVLMYGLRDREAAIGATLADVYRAAWQDAEDAERASANVDFATLDERMRFPGAPFELKLPRHRCVRVVEHRNRDGSGHLTHVDITELKQQQHDLVTAERRSRETMALLEATLDRMQQGIMMVNADRIVEVCNRRAVELLGLPAEMMASRPRFEDVLAHQWATNEFARSSEDLQAFIKAGGILDKPQSYDRERPDGRVLEITSVPIAGGGVLRTYTDVTERKKQEERIRHVSRHDGLTSLCNREVFLEHLAGAVGRCERTGERFAVHYIDLDRFKPINDRFGHAVGDKVLALLAERMRRIARESDVVARMGGDEFAVLQRHLEQPQSATAMAERMLQGIAQAMEVEGHRLEVGASIGIAHFPEAGHDADALLRGADAAMYAAKAAGRDCCRIFGPGTATP